ncbi:MAG: hypothetical protein Q8O93_01560 [bacterium]|nr:hypothetical protein [bacterium]
MSASFSLKHELLLKGEASQKPTFIKLAECMAQNNGRVPMAYWSLARELESCAIVYRLAQNNGQLTAELAPVSSICYKHYLRLNNGPRCLRWFWMLTLPLFQAEYLRELIRLINKAAEAANKI